MAYIELPDVVSSASVKQYLTDIVWPAFVSERERLDRLSFWVRGMQPDYLVQNGSAEKRALLKLAKTPWLGLIVSHFAQALFVDGYRAEGAKDNSSGPWRTWNANSMLSRQIGIHRAALTYGYSYARVLSGTALDGANQAEIRGLSPRHVFCLYEDQVNDEYPRYALELSQNQRSVRFYDERVYYEFDMPLTGQFSDDPVVVEHGVGVTPFVRYANMLDLDGHLMGEIEPLVASACRIDKTDNDRLLAQHYNSWKIKVATGIDDVDDEASPEDVQKAYMSLQHDSVLLHGSSEAKFYTLPETSLDGFITAHVQDVESLAINAQLPPWLFTGTLANLSADALTAAMHPTHQKLAERQVSFGSSHNQVMRLAAHVEGDVAAAADFTASVTWQDTSVRSLAQAVDAYGKAAQMLGMPKEFLWGKVPGFNQSDIETMESMFAADDELSQQLKFWTANGPGGPFGAAPSSPAQLAQQDQPTDSSDSAS